jgi:hypothetical protein
MNLSEVLHAPLIRVALTLKLPVVRCDGGVRRAFFMMIQLYIPTFFEARHLPPLTTFTTTYFLTFYDWVRPRSQVMLMLIRLY